MAGDSAGGDPQARNPFRRVWWLPVVRGVLIVVLGLLLLVEPLEDFDVLRVVIGGFLVADAALVVVQGFVHRGQVGSVGWLAQAAVNLVFGAIVAFWPGLTVTALYYVLAVWVLVLGVTAIVGAAGLSRNRDLGWPWMLTSGTVSVLFGLLLVTRPLVAVDVLQLVVVTFALYSFVAGTVHIVSGFAVRSLAHELADLRGQALAAGVTVTGGSVLGARAADPGVAPPSARAPGDEHTSSGGGATAAPEATGPEATAAPEATGPEATGPEATGPEATAAPEGSPRP